MDFNDAAAGFFLTKAFKAVEKLARPITKPIGKIAKKIGGPVYLQAAFVVKAAEGGHPSAKALISNLTKDFERSAKTAAPMNPASAHALAALVKARRALKSGKLDLNECFAAKSFAASAGELAIVGGLPRDKALELVTAGCGACAGGHWISTAGGDVFVPAAYEGTVGARAARGAALRITPLTRQQLHWAFAAERRGQLASGTARRWAERAVSGFESAHGGAQTLREWLGQEPSLNIALK